MSTRALLANVAVVVMTAAAVGRASGGGGRASRAVAASDTGGKATPEYPASNTPVRRTGCDLVTEYLSAGRQPGAVLASKDDGAPGDSSAHGATPEPRCPAATATKGGVAVAHALVVVLPDPRDSHLDWAFDSGIESVRRAFERVGYVLDRYWLPWTPVTDAGARSSPTPVAPLQSLAPGVMLFRRGREHRDSIALAYLVGETPTRGIQAVAFRAALDDREAVLASLQDAPRADDTLRIVGPVLSGSTRSLRDALDDWHRTRTQPVPVSVISGGATAPLNAEVLRNCVDRRWPVGDRPRGVAPGGEAPPTGAPCPGPHIEFAATVIPLDALKARIESLLEDSLGIPPRAIAYLTESGTQYGRSLRPDSVASHATSDPAGRTAADKRDTTSARLEGLPLEIPFPMNISRLRQEYRREILPTDTLARTGQPQSRTRLEWRDPASVAESPAPFSDLTAPTIERTIADIEQTLRLHHVRAVGVLATDVRDRLFLASVVREQLRDVNVFLIGSHSLYLRPELNEQLRGTMVVSTYPLFLENQFWDVTHNADRQRLVFTSDAAEGTFNAALAQLGADSAMVDYDFPAFPARAADTLFTPPAWVTVVGARSLLPLVATRGSPSLPDPPSISYVLPRHRPRARSAPEAPPAGVGTIVLGAALLFVFGVTFVAHAFPTARSLRAIWSTVKQTIRRSDPRGAGREGGPEASAAPPGKLSDWWRVQQLSLLLHRHSWMMFRFVAVVCAFGPVALVLFQPSIHGGPQSRLSLYLLAVAILATMLGVLRAWTRTFSLYARYAAGTGRLSRRVGEVLGWSRLSQHVVLLGVAFLYLLFTAALVTKASMLDGSTAGMFFLRALELGSGVTPVVPLFVGAVLLVAWCSWHLRRVWRLSEVSAFEVACSDSKIDATEPGCFGRLAPERATPAVGDEAEGERAGELGSPLAFKDAVCAIRRGLLDFLPRADAGVLSVGLGLVGLWVLIQFDRSIDTAILGPISNRLHIPSSFDLLFRFLIFGSITLGVWGLYRLTTVWWALRRCLRSIDAMRLGSAFGRLPPSIAALTRFTPFNAPSTSQVDLTIDREAYSRWLRLSQERSTCPQRLIALCPGDERPQPRLRSHVNDLDEHTADSLVVLHSELCAAGRTREVYLAAMVDDAPAMKHEPHVEAPALPAGCGWVPIAQELVALYVIDYLEWVVRHLRDLALYLILCLALTMILLTSYPFGPASLVKVLFFVLMATAVAVIATVLFQMNRDATLSRITQTAVGQVTWDLQFVLNLLLVAGVPLLTVVSAEFPEVRGFLFSWVTPAVRTLGKT